MKKSIFFIVFLTTFALCAYIYFDENPYQRGQVIGIAKADPSAYLLNISQHISLESRPVDRYEFPIAIGASGPSQSLYSGPNQYPFYCMTVRSGMGQPLIDNQLGQGIQIYQTDPEGNPTDLVLGYSKDCALATQIEYFYRGKIDGGIKQYDLMSSPNDAKIKKVIINGQVVPEIYRVEHGTINRFIYVIAMLADPTKGRLDQSLWNKRLVYQFQGGSGIGFRQGKESGPHIIQKRIDQLKLGYAVITSSANKTSYTYNMLLAEDTAMRVKRQFISLYGEPLYTVGIGGSGGGLSQYLLGQNGTD